MRSNTLKRGHRTTALLFFVAALKITSLRLLCPLSAHAQGGVPLWTNVFRGSHYSPALAVDINGNVFVTGAASNGTNIDYTTIKYSNAGTSLWSNRYDGPAATGVAACAIAVDASGNVFVTRTSDFATIKYSNSGVPLWTNRYEGPANRDYARAIAVDSSGNGVVTGRSLADSNDLFNEDYATIAYSNSGVPLWTNRYDWPVNERDYAMAIAVDGSGNVFVTGFSYSDSINRDYATVTYSSAGDLLWENRYDGPGSGSDAASAIAVEGSGNVFITGISTGSGSGSDFATIKYSNSGVPLWTNRYNGPASKDDNAWAIAVDSNGNVFVTGVSYPANGGGDYVTIKYSSDGSALWTRRYNGPSDSQDSPSALALDSSGNVFVTGWSWNNGSDYDYATVAYTSAGAPLWTNRYHGPANGWDSPTAIAVDSSGNVFVTGWSENGTNTDYVTIKYSSSVPPPRLAFQKLNNDLVLSWTNVGFHLQSAPAVTGPFTNLPAATSPYTNPLAAPQQFFRLSSN